jgi:hypothetical protein
MKYFAFIIGLFSICTIALAQENDMLQMELEEEYYQRLNASPDKSRIYIFFNNEPCLNCPQAIEMIEEVYNQNYLNNYELFLINYAEDTNSGFIEEYNLSQPLEVVMIDVENATPTGYQKIEGLQNMTANPSAFNEFFTTQVNGYLQNQ